jgi:putative phosphoribosyl transferase
MPFLDRADAGRRLAAALLKLRGQDVVVLGLPRGGVPVAAEVARALHAPLDVVVVRKLGVPVQPELGMGAIGEDGVRVINPAVVQMTQVTTGEIAAVEDRERRELRRRALRFRGDRLPVPVAGRTAIIIDDGIATGSTARAACQVTRARGAARVVLAVPVAPSSAGTALAGDADEVICLETPEFFNAIGEWYDDFSQTGDEEVVGLLRRNAAEAGPATGARPGPRAWPAGPAAGGPARAGAPGTGPAGAWPGSSGPGSSGHGGGGPGSGGPASASQPSGASPARGSPGTGPPGAGAWDQQVIVAAGPVALAGQLTVPPDAAGLVVFAHGSGSSRHSPRNRYVAGVFTEAGLGTLLFDLLTQEEERDRGNVFDIGLLAGRLAAASGWLRQHPAAAGSRIGYFGASTGAAAALWAAAEPGSEIAAVVSRGGRPDLAMPRLAEVRAPTLLIVGSLDDAVLGMNRTAQEHLECENQLAVVPGATHLFEEPGTLERAAGLARDWFTGHLAPAHARA